MVRTITMTITTTTTFIPRDIIVEILSRLPAKSVLQLRWACKYWFDLISRDTEFHKLHLHRSTTSDHDYSVLSSASFIDKSVPKYNIHHYLNYTTGSLSCNQQNIACPVEPRNRSENSITCINGLMFYRIKQEELGSFCIWNPCTKEYRVISVPDTPMFIKFNDIRANKTCLGRYGFGYDHTINDYKVVRHDYYYYVDGRHNKFLASDVQIYTLGTNSWRSIGPVPYEQPKPLLESGVFVNGALHWLLGPSGEKIVSFNIGKEEYKEVLVKQLQPVSSDGIWECTRELQVFKGSLCCLVGLRLDYKHCFEMWMMKDYDENNNEYSWNKLFRTSEAYHRCPTLLRSTQDDEILQCSTWFISTQNGEVLMLTQFGELVVYDPKTDTRRPVNRICWEEKCYHVVDALYTESLVSLNSGIYTGARGGSQKSEVGRAGIHCTESEVERAEIMGVNGSIHTRKSESESHQKQKIRIR